MSNSEIAMQLTLKALEEGYIPKKSLNHFSGEDPFAEATKYAATQISDFYQKVYDSLGNL